MQSSSIRVTNPNSGDTLCGFSGFYYPSCIWLDQHLKTSEKNLLAEICSLEQLPKGCIASNEHFAARLNINSRSVSRHIKSLKRRGYLTVVSFDGRYRKLKINPDKLEPRQIAPTGEPKNQPGIIEALPKSRFIEDKNVEVTSTNVVNKEVSVDQNCIPPRQIVPIAPTECRPTIVNTNIITKENYRDSLVKDQLKRSENPDSSGKPITNHQKPITKDQKPITNHQKPITKNQQTAFETAWTNWLTYREEIKKPYRSAMSIKQTLAKLARYQEAFAVELIEKSIANGTALRYLRTGRGLFMAAQTNSIKSGLPPKTPREQAPEPSQNFKVPANRGKICWSTAARATGFITKW